MCISSVAQSIIEIGMNGKNVEIVCIIPTWLAVRLDCGRRLWLVIVAISFKQDSGESVLFGFVDVA